MKGLDPTFCQHQINLHKDPKPVQERRYHLNLNYAVNVKEEIDKLLWVGFIRPIKKDTWLSLIVVPKKNGKIRVCVDYWKLNKAAVTNAFPLPFIDGVLDAVARHEIYSFLDGFSDYNQVRMHPNYQEKTTFVTEWGVFVAIVMMFGLKTTPTTFQRVIQESFCRLYTDIYAGVFGWLCSLQQANRSLQTSSIMSREVSTGKVKFKSSEMCIRCDGLNTIGAYC